MKRTIISLARRISLGAMGLAWAGVALAGTPTSGQLGVLNLSANGGLNPATGAPWAVGDKYRLVFVSSAFYGPATSTEIADYNAFAQSMADGSSLGLGSVSWKAVGSTTAVDARDNTATNPDVNGVGEPIFRVDGVTLVATNYVDLWNGVVNPVRTDENNVEFRKDTAAGWSTWGFTWTGTSGDGTAMSGYELGAGGNVEAGLADATGVQWVQRTNEKDGSTTTNALLYAISEPLTVLGSVGSYVEFE